MTKGPYALCAALMVTAAAANAQAATKLCVGAKVQGTIDVPPNPRFVIASNERALASRAREHLQTRNRQGEPVGGGKTFGHTDQLIDSYRVSRTVRAEDGHQFVMALPNHLCTTPRYRVDRNWKRRAGAPAPMAAVLNQNKAEHAQIVLMWRPSRQLSWTRIDWAYTRQDLDRGLHGSVHEVESSDGPQPSAYLAVEPHVTRVHLRLTRFHLDGTDSRWQGWLERDDQDRMRIRSGEPPAESSPSTDLAACAAADRSARPVPINPTFRARQWDTPRFVAVSSDGTQLPHATRSLDRHPSHAATTVDAGEGQRFWLRRLPVATGCPTERLLVATADRSRDEAPAITHAQAPGCSAELDIEGPDTWGYLEVSSQPLTGQTVPDHLSQVTTIASDLSAPTLYASPVSVTITPVWSNGQRGASWTGWVASTGCDEATFGHVATMAAPAAMAPVDQMTVPPAQTRPMACSAKRCSTKRWLLFSLLLSLALGLLLYRRYRRRADRNMWV